MGCGWGLGIPAHSPPVPAHTAGRPGAGPVAPWWGLAATAISAMVVTPTAGGRSVATGVRAGPGGRGGPAAGRR